MKSGRRRPRDAAGDGGETDGFPCWLGCDAHGIRAMSWEAVRLVELVEVKATRSATQDRHHSDGSICVSMSDGSEHDFDAVTLTMDDLGLIIDAAYLIRIRDALSDQIDTVPP